MPTSKKQKDSLGSELLPAMQPSTIIEMPTIMTKRKSLLLLLLCSLLMLASCHFDSSIKFSDLGERIAPSDHIVKQEFAQPPFDKVSLDVPANVKFIQTAEEKPRVVISAPDNYLELFLLKVNKRKLAITFTKKNANIETDNVDVTVYSPTLIELENRGLANVEVDRVSGSSLKVTNSGVGSLYFSGLGLERLEATCDGVGNVELGGTARWARLDCSGVGSIAAEQLQADTVVGEVSGVGGISCFARKAIKGVVSGVGSLNYGGNPPDKELKRTGVGGISEL